MVKILIADDDRMSLRLLEKTLEREGYEVIAVENGRLALEQLSLPEAPRLALLDWMMPELDGPGICFEIRKQQERPYVHIILLTSRESKEDVVAGLVAGADDYLTKPWDPAELTARLQVGHRILQLEDRLVEARETMRFKATHDHLTSLFNRGVIVDLLDRELIRTRREKGCTVVMLGDLDQFKSVNDQYGHIVGDEVLREIARRLRRQYGPMILWVVTAVKSSLLFSTIATPSRPSCVPNRCGMGSPAIQYKRRAVRSPSR